jgi:hypothetical protein
MKGEIRKNGELKVILSHEDDMDKAALEALAKGGDIIGTLILSQEQATKFDVPIGSIILTNKLIKNV